MTPDDARRDKMPSRNFHGFKSMPNQGKQMMHANKKYIYNLPIFQNIPKSLVFDTAMSLK